MQSRSLSWRHSSVLSVLAKTMLKASPQPHGCNIFIWWWRLFTRFLFDNHPQKSRLRFPKGRHVLHQLCAPGTATSWRFDVKSPASVFCGINQGAGWAAWGSHPTLTGESERLSPDLPRPGSDLWATPGRKGPDTQTNQIQNPKATRPNQTFHETDLLHPWKHWNRRNCSSFFSSSKEEFMHFLHIHTACRALCFLICSRLNCSEYLLPISITCKWCVLS